MKTDVFPLPCADKVFNHLSHYLHVLVDQASVADTEGGGWGGGVLGVPRNLLPSSPVEVYVL